MYSVTSSTNTDDFTSFPLWISFLFSSLITVAKTAETLLNKTGKSVHSCLAPDLRANAFSFSPSSMILPVGLSWASLVAQRLKRLPAVRENWVWSLGQEDLLEKEMATHSSILAWKIPWMEEPGELQSLGSQRVGHDWVTSLAVSLVIYGLYCVEVGSLWVFLLAELTGDLVWLLVRKIP